MQEKMSQNADTHIHHRFQSAILDCSDVKVTLPQVELFMS